MRTALAALLLTLVAALALLAPVATRSHVVFSSTPNPPPLFQVTPLELAPGNTACTSGVVLGDDAELVRINVAAPGGPDAVPLRLRLSGSGYRATRTLRDYPAIGALVEIGIPRPRRPTPATLCITNAGARALTLASTTESRTASRTTTTVDGKPTNADPTILLLRREPRSFASMLPTLFERAATFKPGFAGPWLFWLLAGLLVVGLPLGVAVALSVEPRERDPQAPDLQQDRSAQDHRRIAAAEMARQDAAGDGDGHRHE